MSCGTLFQNLRLHNEVGALKKKKFFFTGEKEDFMGPEKNQLSIYHFALILQASYSFSTFLTLRNPPAIRHVPEHGEGKW